MVKNRIFILISIFSVLACLPVFGAELPNRIWPAFHKYVEAEAVGNDFEILKLGEELLDIMKSEPESITKKEFLAGKYEPLAKSAENLQQYEKAIMYYQKYVDIGGDFGWETMYAQQKVRVLQSYLEIYIEDSTYEPTYYWGKFEPKTGVLYGSTYDKDPRINSYNVSDILRHFPKKNSLFLMYLEFGDEIEDNGRFKNYFAEAKNNNIAIEFAWNTEYSLHDYMLYDAYIKRTIDKLQNVGVPIFLRFASEMNTGDNGYNAAQYIESFRYVARYAKTKSNIAVVWSPVEIGSQDRPFINYYPGDEYVDWVGVSLYPNKYFQGQKNQTDNINTSFMTDEYSNPVLRMMPLMEFMKDNKINKPVMISECGAPHIVRTNNEDTTVWGARQLERMYSEMLRYYPQIKAICYFNVNMKNEYYNYSLYDSPVMNETYNNMVSSPYFISNYNENAGIAYRPFTGGDYPTDKHIKLSTFAYYPKKFYYNVKYLINGSLVHETGTPPYEFNLNPADFGAGKHELKVQVTEFDKVLVEKSMPLNILGGDVFLNNIQNDTPNTTSGAGFTDVPSSHEFYKELTVLKSLGILGGMDDGSFKPNSNITRAEFSAIIVRMLGETPSSPGAKIFSDVSPDHWASGYIEKARDLGIINGLGDGTFLPEADVTYEQSLKMLVSALGYAPMAEERGGYPDGYVSTATSLNLRAGTFDKTGATTRGVVAKLLYNSLDVYKLVKTEDDVYKQDGSGILSDNYNISSLDELLRSLGLN